MNQVVHFLLGLSVATISVAVAGLSRQLRELDERRYGNVDYFHHRITYLNERVDTIQAELSRLGRHLDDWPTPRRVDPERQAPSVHD